MDGPGFGANNTINVIGITIPSIIILISYLKIWLQWRRNKKNLKSVVMNKTGHEDVKLGFSMLLICISFMTFSSLLIIYELVLRSNNSGSSMVFLCLFWFQFYSNFLIYAIWNEQYRKSFYFFFRNVMFCKSLCPYSYFGNKPIDANVILKQGAIHMWQFFSPHFGVVSEFLELRKIYKTLFHGNFLLFS